MGKITPEEIFQKLEGFIHDPQHSRAFEGSLLHVYIVYLRCEHERGN